MPDFVMPSLGADMDAGTLLEWLVKPGDAVHRGDVVAVVDTDKAAIEVECFDDGVVEQLIVEPGAKVPVGAPLARIGTGEGVAVPAPARVPVPVPAMAPAPAPAAGPLPAAGEPLVTSPLVRHLAADRGLDLHAVPASGPGGVVHRADLDRTASTTAGPPPAQAPAGPPPAQAAPPLPPAVRASPMARRLAAAEGLDLSGVEGTGPNGAISAEDVRRALLPAPHRPPRTPRPRPHRAARPRAAAAPPATSAADEKARAMRHAIAALMERSNREIPHYYLTSTIDLTALTAWLRARNRELPVEQRLVPAAALLVATARAAHDVGQLNGHWIDDEFRPADRVDLGLVVSLRRGGIMVPVVTDAANRSVEQLMAALRDLVERARLGRLRGSELGQPSITVSNLGDQGVESVLGVVYPPQVALVGFGAVVERPWAVDGLLGVRPVVTASLAADHRASDGAIGARLLTRIDRLLQNPEEL